MKEETEKEVAFRLKSISIQLFHIPFRRLLVGRLFIYMCGMGGMGIVQIDFVKHAH